MWFIDAFPDLVIGCATVPVVLILAMLTGGFMFYQPWVFWMVVILFGAGFSRTMLPGDSFWIRAMQIDAWWFFVLPLAYREESLPVIAISAATLLPTVAGLLSRQMLRSRRTGSL